MNETYLEDIDTGRFRLIKSARGHESGKSLTRRVYLDCMNSLYYKIWDRDYRDRDYFLAAYEAGCFGEISTLTSIIYDADNSCRGYVSAKGAGVCHTQLRVSASVIADLQEQDHEPYRDFYRQLLQTTVKCGYVFIDFTPGNVIFLDGSYKMIDLEAVRPLHTLGAAFFNSQYNPGDYRDSIETLKMESRL